VDVQGTCKISLKPECPDCPASDKSGTIMIKKANAGTSPVPEKWESIWYRNDPVADPDPGCRNADSVGIGLDADAQLWRVPEKEKLLQIFNLK
jgi:hypothetical protein